MLYKIGARTIDLITNDQCGQIIKYINKHCYSNIFNFKFYFKQIFKYKRCMGTYKSSKFEKNLSEAWAIM